MQVVVLLVVREGAVCQEGGSAIYPLWVWLITVPVFLLRFCIEMKALRCASVPYLKTAQQGNKAAFSVLGRQTTFSVWFAYAIFMSQLGFLDGVTDSTFSGTLLRSMNCPSERLSELWDGVWQQSILAHVGIWPSLRAAAWLVWLWSFLYLIYAMVASFRRAGGYNRTGSYHGTNIFGERLYDGDVVMLLAGCNGMQTLQSLSVTYKSLRVQTRVQQEGDIGPALNGALALGQQVVSVFLLSHISETCMQLNIQSTLFAIDRFLRNRKQKQANVQALVSLGIGIATTALKVKEAKSFLDFASEVLDMARSSDPEHIYEGKPNSTRAVALRRRVLFLRTCCALMLMCLLYASCKMVAAFVCHDSVWNVTGCSDLRHLHSGL